MRLLLLEIESRRMVVCKGVDDSVLVAAVTLVV